jgi:hypothetical protein
MSLKPKRSAILFVLALQAGGFSAASAAGNEPQPATAEADPWVQIGSFSGAHSDSFRDFVENEVFREARTGDLFQDLGDLQLQLTASVEGARLGMQGHAERRVVARHEDLPPGSPVADGDLSRFQAINSLTHKTFLKADYVSDGLGPLILRFEAEAGFSLSAAETQPPRALDLTPNRKLPSPQLIAGLAQYWKDTGWRLNRQILPKTGRSLLLLLDALAAGIGRSFEDTERGAVFLEGFVEPLTLWSDLGVPVPVEIFRRDDPRLEPGDTVTYTSFLGISPLTAGAGGFGLQTSHQGFVRFVRQTTAVKQRDDTVLVRVKSIASRGTELTPLKIRPTIGWFFLNYGYTFVNDRRNRSSFRTWELTYRMDLKTPDGRAALADLFGDDRPVRFSTALAAVQSGGVKLLAQSYREGNRRDLVSLARIPSWWRLQRADFTILQELETPRLHRMEAIRARSRTVRQRLGQRQNRDFRSVLTLRSEPRPPGSPDPTAADQPPPVPALLTIQTVLRDRYADRHRQEELLALVRRNLGDGPETHKLALPPEKEPSGQNGIQLSLELSFRREQMLQFLRTPVDELWTSLAEFYLGPALRTAWSTEKKRAWWAPREFWTPAGRPTGRHISVFYDQALRRQAQGAAEGRLASPFAPHGSRWAFLEAQRFVHAFTELGEEVGQGGDCWRCWLRLYASPEDVNFLQTFLTRTVQGYADSWQAAVWAEGMPRPVRIGRQVESNELGSMAELVAAVSEGSPDSGVEIQDAEQIRSSDSRLAGGRIFIDTQAAVDGGRYPLRLDLYSDLQFPESLRLRLELRKSRIRSDTVITVAMMELGPPVPEPESPFRLARYRYEVPLPATLALLEPGIAYTVYLRVLNSQGLPVTEEQPLRFRIPKVGNGK